MAAAAPIAEGGILATEGIAELVGGTAARTAVQRSVGGFFSKLTKPLMSHAGDILNVATMGMMMMPPEHHDAPQPINPPPPPPAKPPDPPLPTPAATALAPIPPPPPPPPPPKAPTDFSANGGAGSNEPQHVYNETHHGESSQITSDSSPLVTLIAIAGGGFILFYVIKKLT